MKKIFGILLLSGACAFSSEAQMAQPCGLDEVRKKMIEQNPAAAHEMQQYEERLKTATLNRALMKSSSLVDTIPVVFHIVLKAVQIQQLGGIQGITTRANDQIDALNRDYNAANGDSVDIPAPFKSLYGNANVHFALAHTSPSGAPSPGFTIDTANVIGFDPAAQGTAGSGYFCSDAKYASSGGADSWNAGRYLNVWVVNTAPNGTQGGYIAGIATHPSMTNQLPQAEWGCVIHSFSFGQKKNNNLLFASGMDSGRVLVHEVGHYLGLWHVWGNDQGGCSSDDGISDTPPQDYSTQSYCPTFPLTDMCSPSYPGVMYMNFMDYSSEDCQHMFSHGQVNRFHASLDQTYPQLTQYPELTRYPLTSSVAGIEENDPKFTISPNPARNVAQINVAKSNNDLKKILVLSNVGQKMAEIVPEANASIYNIDVSSYPAGVYFVQCLYANGSQVQKLLVN